MAKIANLTLRREDFPDLGGDRLDRLFRAVNAFAKSVTDALNGGLTAEGNVATAYYEDRFTAPLSAHGFTVALPKGTMPRAVTVAQAYCDTDRTPASVGNPAWQFTGTCITVSALSGLTDGKQYRITYRVEGA